MCNVLHRLTHVWDTWSPASGIILEGCGTFRSRALLERSEHWGQPWGFIALRTSCSLSASTTASCSHPYPSTMEWIPQTLSQKRSFLPYTVYWWVFCSTAETVTSVPRASVCGSRIISRIILVVAWHFANYIHGRYWIYWVLGEIYTWRTGQIRKTFYPNYICYPRTWYLLPATIPNRWSAVWKSTLGLALCHEDWSL